MTRKDAAAKPDLRADGRDRFKIAVDTAIMSGAKHRSEKAEKYNSKLKAETVKHYQQDLTDSFAEEMAHKADREKLGF